MICLVMIVKNESHVLRRALASVKGLVECVYISDTGSDDAEFDAMSDILAECGIDYTIDRTEWVNFAFNRNLALVDARTVFPKADYQLMMDADDYVETFGTPAFAPGSDGYYVDVKGGSITYPRVQVFNVNSGWRYRGVVHEFPDLQMAAVSRAAIVIKSTREGARNHDEDKYSKDAALLYGALNSGNCEPDLIPRYQFYLAQSYHDAGDLMRAKKWYQDRADNEDGYIEERYVSAYRLAQIAYRENKGPLIIGALCRSAQDICPHRREAARWAMKAYNETGRHKDAMRVWRENPIFGGPPVGLFIEPAVYEWQMFEEAGIAAYYCNEHKQSVYCLFAALQGLRDMPLDVQRLVRNMSWSLGKL